MNGDAQTRLAEAVGIWIREREDRMLARDLRHLLREGGCPESGHRARRARAVLAGDPALAAFFRSVADGGEEARAEERDRVRHHRARVLRGSPHPRLDHPADTLPAWAIAACMPQWRAWGQLILDAGQESHGGAG